MMVFSIKKHPDGKPFISKYEADVEKIEKIEPSDEPFRCMNCGSIIRGARISMGSNMICEKCMEESQ